MTCATTRRNLKQFACWADAHPFRGGSGEVSRWLADGIEKVVGVRPMTINQKVVSAFFEEPTPPSWTPQGAAERLRKAAERLPQVRSALARAEADLALKKSAFFTSMSVEDARAFGAFMDAPVAALEGRQADAGTCAAAKVANLGAAQAIRRVMANGGN